MLMTLPAKQKKEKILTTLLCGLGILALGYGMAKANNAVFIVGLLCVIAGYLLIRRRLKHSDRQQSGESSPR
jgi:1,4-dihydroxy-2-naphthoate octaprenyltransferase